MRKFRYYSLHALLSVIPASWLQAYTRYCLKSLKNSDREYIWQRVNYYNKLEDNFSVSNQAVPIGQYKKTGGSTYYYDLLKIIKGFDKYYKFDYLNGDIIHIPASPHFLKSRPISDDNANSVLLKLNSIRHFLFVKDTVNFREKSDQLVWRGSGFRPNRRLLLERFFDNPRCNVGRTDTQDKDQLHYVVPKLSIEEQLKYKFILSLEGKDVATNLKWIMSSNSLCLTPKLHYETWFMEGKLKAGVHYVEVKDDYSDLLEKMDYYIDHPEEAEQIIANAHAWVAQFTDKKREHLISLLVAQKYFNLSSSAGNRYEKR